MAIASCCCNVDFAQGSSLQISIPLPEHFSYYIYCLIVFSFAYYLSAIPCQDSHSLVSPFMREAHQHPYVHPVLSFSTRIWYTFSFFLLVFAYSIFRLQVSYVSSILPMMARLVRCPCYSTGLDVLTPLEFRPCSSLIIFPRFSLSTILHLMSKAFFYITCISSIHQVLLGILSCSVFDMGAVIYIHFLCLNWHYSRLSFFC